MNLLNYVDALVIFALLVRKEANMVLINIILIG